jgi:hypothetical protein
MPTLADIGEGLRQRLLASPRLTAMLGERSSQILAQGDIPSGNVEMWLSSLAERQPFMTESEGSLNRALFQEVSQYLVDLVTEPQQGFWPEAPSWLHRLLRLWHRRQVAVVTFNYDTIVEESMVNLDAPHADGDIVAAMLTHLPRQAVTGLGGAVLIPTLRLLKLHGSVDWYWNPDDGSGDSLCRRNPDLTVVDARAALAGKVPFIVPPLATKSPFYSLGVIRQLWQDAAHALQAASRIVVLGYSVPLTDLTTTAMLSHAGNPSAEWHVVDLDGDAVRARLIHLGVPARTIEVHYSVADWVDVYEREHCCKMTREVSDQLLSFQEGDGTRTAPIMIRRSRSDYGIVRSIRTVGAHVLLEAHALDTREVIPAEYPHKPDLDEALRAVNPPGPLNVLLDGVEGEHRVLGALDPSTVRGSGAVLDWCPLEIQDVPTPANP